MTNLTAEPLPPYLSAAEIGTDAQFEAFHRRLLRCFELVFGMEASQLVMDPITGRFARFTRARGARHKEAQAGTTRLTTPREACFFCQLQTPPNLLYVNEAGEIVVPNEQHSFLAAADFLSGKDTGKVETYYGLVQHLAQYNHIEGAWLARTFCNLTPALGRTSRLPLCLVQGIHPDYHNTEFNELPPSVVQAVILSWQFIERFAQEHGLLAVPFINGGKRPESGQSVACFHGQVYLFHSLPFLFQEIGRRRAEAGHCPICQDILQGKSSELAIWNGHSLVVLAHPVPRRTWSLLVVPKTHTADLHSIEASEFADVLLRCVRAYQRLHHREPAYNIVVRAGDAVGHLHAEIVPKTETNIIAGAEEATDEIIIDVLPQQVKEQLQPLMA